MPVPTEKSFTSMVLNREVKTSNTIDLAGDWDLLGVGSLWEQTELLFFPQSSEIFPFTGETLAKVKGALDLSRD